jgi:sirohydrochlorin ferrochelatase
MSVVVQLLPADWSALGASPYGGGVMTRPEPALVLLAHGTRDAGGAAAIDLLAELLRAELPTVAVAYADVRPPSLTETVAAIDGAAVIVPAFLSAGYHVRVDVPAQLAATGRCDVSLAHSLGPDPELVEVAYQRLVEAGWVSGDQVVLAAAGSRDPRAIQDVGRAARLLGDRLGGPVQIGYAAGDPRVADIVSRAGADRSVRVSVASWLLAPGVFQRALAAAGADVVADPLGAHPRVAAVVRARYDAALAAGAPGPTRSAMGAAGDTG